ncbi:MAG: hypothetical protein IPN95_19575 [Bacteroidetes bacterium]|nr:hypothetical protein [Bacteroidota bacterium]
MRLHTSTDDCRQIGGARTFGRLAHEQGDDRVGTGILGKTGKRFDAWLRLKQDFSVTFHFDKGEGKTQAPATEIT